MKIESACGLRCSQCEDREPQNCPTCKSGTPFWGENCPVQDCVYAKGYQHCGECPDIPCQELTEMAYDPEQGDNGRRIQQCKEWHAVSLQKILLEYALAKPGTRKDYKEEWDWERLLVGEKLFLTFAHLEERPIATIKLQPDHGSLLRRSFPDKIVAGYYMNKEHWNTIYLDFPWDPTFFISLMDEAYELVFSSLTQKKQKEILASAESLTTM